MLLYDLQVKNEVFTRTIKYVGSPKENMLLEFEAEPGFKKMYPFYLIEKNFNKTANLIYKNRSTIRT